MVDIVIRLLMALEAVVCLMLIGIILIQRSKGHGMGLSFGGGSAEAVFGGQMGNVLTRTTVILAVVFLVNTTVLAILKPKGVSADVTDRFAEPPPAAAAAPAALPEAPLPDVAAVDDLLDVSAPEAPAPAPAAEAPEAPAPAPAEAPAPEAPAPETPAPAAEPAAAETPAS